MPLCLFWPRCGKGKLEDGDGINLNDIEKVLPAWQVGTGAASPTTALPLLAAWTGPEHGAGPWLSQGTAGCTATVGGPGRVPALVQSVPW